jgi:hypothetical protein
MYAGGASARDYICVNPLQPDTLFGAQDPHRIVIHTGEAMLKRVLVVLIASAFSVGAFAQGQTGAAAKPAEAAKATTPAVKSEKKSDAKAKSKKAAKGKNGAMKKDEKK